MDASRTALAAKELAGRAFDDLLNFLSLLMFFSVTAVLFRSIEFALIVTASLGFHELGHAVLIAFYRLKWRITFGFVGAWTWSPAAGRSKLSNMANSTIHLAGPLFSLLLGLGALGMAALSPFEDSHLLLLANFSAQVAILNLIPLGAFTDGGKVVQRIIAPLTGIERLLAAGFPLLVTLLLMGISGLVGQPFDHQNQLGAFWLGMLLVGAWMACSFLLEAHRSRPEMVPVRLQLNRAQGYILWLLIWLLLVLALWIAESSPFWLSPKYVIGCLRNIADVLALLINLLR